MLLRLLLDYLVEEAVAFTSGAVRTIAACRQMEALGLDSKSCGALHDAIAKLSESVSD